MAKENIKVITPETKTTVLTKYFFPVESVTIEAESLEEAKKILHLQILNKDK